MNIGTYQLRNLIANRVKFQYFDLRAEPAAEHPLLEGSRRIAAAAVDDVLNENGTPLDGAIVLICADGVVSSQLAARLEARSYINIFVVEGGVAALD